MVYQLVIILPIFHNIFEEHVWIHQVLSDFGAGTCSGAGGRDAQVVLFGAAVMVTPSDLRYQAPAWWTTAALWSWTPRSARLFNGSSGPKSWGFYRHVVGLSENVG